MVKHCCYGTCKSDSRKSDKFVVFFPFPKPKTRYEACLHWIKACGRPHSDFNIQKITKDTYICSKHFVDGHPSDNFPDPVPADGSAVKKGRPAPKRRMQTTDSSISNETQKRQKTREDEPKEFTSRNDLASDPPILQEVTYSSLDNLANACELKRLENEIERLKLQVKEEQKIRQSVEQQLASAVLKEEALRRSFDEKVAKMNLDTREIGFSVEMVNQSQIKALLKYYTGFDYNGFQALFKYLIPRPDENPICYTEKPIACMKLNLKNQFFLVMCRLRNEFHIKDLAYRFNIAEQLVSVIFLSWIQYMYLRLGYLSLWPDRNTIIQHMTTAFKKDFPNTIAIIDCTEIKTERPSSLSCQTQLYSDYKSTTTLKALVATDPRGSLMYTSSLFTGSISDNNICKDSGFYDLLQDHIKNNKIQLNDAIMDDKGFTIEKGLKDLGLQLNIPPFSFSTGQMTSADVQKTRVIATHRIHVERAINRIKNFKLLNKRTPACLFHNVNEIWLVCCYLTAFQDVLVKMPKS